MATACITRRKRAKGAKYPTGFAYQVRYRAGGRASKVHDAGTFAKRQHAVERVNFVLREVSDGRDPMESIRALGASVDVILGLGSAWDRFVESRVDVSMVAIRHYGNARDTFVPLLGEDTPPATITLGELQAAVNTAALKLSPETLRKYLNVLQQVFDYDDVLPNLARSKKLRRPSEVQEEYVPATLAECEAIFAQLADDMRELFELTECLGTRIEETLTFQRGDVDFAEGCLRLSKARTKKGSGGQRILPLPPVLLDRIAERVGPDAAHDRRVFHGITYNQAARALRAACRAAGVRTITPHGFRHRRISLWLGHGFNPVRAGYWAGHTRPSMTTDKYGHVLVSGDDRWFDFWLGAYRKAQGVAV